MPTPNNPFEQIILPTNAPSEWPPAPIYWLISIAFVVILVLVIWAIKRKIKKDKSVKQSLIIITQLRREKSVPFSQLNQLLKGLCLQYYPRETVASLNGAAWFDFIEKHNTTPEKPLFDNKALFCERLYKDDYICSEQDFESAKKWITKFPKKYSALQKSSLINKK